MEKEDLKAQLSQIWLDHDEISKDLSFAFPRTVLSNSVLFIGINPSSRTNDVPGNIDFELQQKGNNDTYFTPIEEVTKDCGTSWSYLDLFYFRKTDQKSIDFILKKDGRGFLWKQLEITGRRIQEAKPKLIVVVNARAADFLGKNKDLSKPEDEQGKWLDYEFYWSEVLGPYFCSNEKYELLPTPILFSSMLSSGVTDKGTKERLAWHIRRILKFDPVCLSIIAQIASIRNQKVNVVKGQDYANSPLLQEEELKLLTLLREQNYQITTLYPQFF